MMPILCLPLFLIGTPFAKDAPVDNLKAATVGHCEDGLVALATVVPRLDCKFFRAVETSYREGIVEDENGNEIDDKTKETHSYKIEGYFKPVVQSAPKGTPPRETDQPDPAQPAAKPADKGAGT